MGASASVDGSVSISDEEKQSLVDISSLLKAYGIKTNEDLKELNEKYELMKAEGTHGLSLIKTLHNTMQVIGEHSAATSADSTPPTPAPTIDNGEDLKKEDGPAAAPAAEPSFGEQAAAEGKNNLAQVKRRTSLMDMNSAVEAARERVRLLTRQVAKENFVNYMVGVDGSPASDNAYEVCLQELGKSKDGVIATHVFDSTKHIKGLDPKLKPDTLKERFDLDLMARANKGRYSLLWLDKEGKRTDAFILQKVNEMISQRHLLDEKDRPSYFVTGMTGRKEVKAQKKIGSLPLMAAGYFLIPNIIVKKPPILDRPRVFVCAIKDLKHVQPYELALDLLKPGNGDKLIVMHVYNNDHSRPNSVKEKLEEFDNYFTAKMKEDGLLKNGSKFLPVPNNEAKPQHKIVLSQLEELQADYVVIYPHIHVPGALTTNNCGEIIEEATCNIVLCRR